LPEAELEAVEEPEREALCVRALAVGLDEALDADALEEEEGEREKAALRVLL